MLHSLKKRLLVLFRSLSPSLSFPTQIMAESLTAEEKIALINENLQEVLKPEVIEDVIVRQNRSLIIYWGISAILNLLKPF